MELGDVWVDGDAGPVLTEDSLAVGVDLTEGDGTESAGSFESKAESADAAEEVEDTKHSRFRRNRSSIRVRLMALHAMKVVLPILLGGIKLKIVITTRLKPQSLLRSEFIEPFLAPLRQGI